MTNNNHDDLPGRAPTTGQQSPVRRLAARLLCSPRRRRTDTDSPAAQDTTVPWPVRHRVLREYHAVNLAQARRASEVLVRAGFNTGSVPYGYRPRRVRVCSPGRPARWRTRLVIEPVEATVAKMIFTWWVQDHLSTAQIRTRLTDSRYPPPLDPATGQPKTWTRAVIRAILRNPKYLGRQVWGRHHRRQPTPPQQWVWSPTWAHPPIVDDDTFTAAQHRYPTTDRPTAVDDPSGRAAP
jgi:hypothetical protein